MRILSAIIFLLIASVGYCGDTIVVYEKDTGEIYAIGNFPKGQYASLGYGEYETNYHLLPKEKNSDVSFRKQLKYNSTTKKVEQKSDSDIQKIADEKKITELQREIDKYELLASTSTLQAKIDVLKAEKVSLETKE